MFESKTKKMAALILSSAFILTSCGTKKTTEDKNSSGYDRETIYQVSLLQDLTFGDYNGSVSVEELKKRGDTGIGTFDRLNGELVMVDGTVYRAAGDGSVEAVEDTETIPFSNVTFMDIDEKLDLTGVKDFEAVEEALDKKVTELGVNAFYMVRIDGTFSEMHVRSELAQEKPYKPLAEVLETDQTFFDYENIKGTVVALYTPPYMSDLNATGWHLHFISDDKTKGGHVLGLSIDNAVASIDTTHGFNMILPDSEEFVKSDFTIDQSEDIKKVEKNKTDGE